MSKKQRDATGQTIMPKDRIFYFSSGMMTYRLLRWEQKPYEDIVIACLFGDLYVAVEKIVVFPQEIFEAIREHTGDGSVYFTNYTFEKVYVAECEWHSQTLTIIRRGSQIPPYQLEKIKDVRATYFRLQ